MEVLCNIDLFSPSSTAMGPVISSMSVLYNSTLLLTSNFSTSPEY